MQDYDKKTSKVLVFDELLFEEHIQEFDCEIILDRFQF